MHNDRNDFDRTVQTAVKSNVDQETEDLVSAHDSTGARVDISDVRTGKRAKAGGGGDNTSIN